MTSYKYFSTVLIGLLVSNAWAQQHPRPVERLQDDGLEVGESFNAPGGMIGYIGRFAGKPIEMYLTPDGDHLVVGTLINAAAEPVARERLNRLSSTSFTWKSLQELHWVVEGNPDAKRIVYVFTDPNCPYCEKFRQAAQPYLAKGNVQLRHILVGLLHPSSAEKAAQILMASDPSAALTQLARKTTSGRSKDVATLSDAPKEVHQQVTQNTQFMQTHQVFATPTVVYKDSSGSLQQVQGLPSSSMMEKEIFQITELSGR